MWVAVRGAAAGLVLGMLAGACAGADGVGIDALAGGSGGQVLSSCVPVGDQRTSVVVESGGELPPVAVMQDALHEMYGQAVGQELFADAQQLTGFVTGVYARPEAGEPFRLAFSGPVPDEFETDAYDLASFGLEVTSGAAGFDQEAFAAAYEAADEVGVQTVSGSGDETVGTGRIEVIDAMPDQVAAWEQAVGDPSRWWLVRAARTVACDVDVVAEARQRADRQGAVLPNEQGDGEPMTGRAGQVRGSYLGLTLEEAEGKAAEEGRAVRVMTRDGVELATEDDLQPGRLSLTVCQGIVVDILMYLEPGR